MIAHYKEPLIDLANARQFPTLQVCQIQVSDTSVRIRCVEMVESSVTHEQLGYKGVLDGLVRYR